MLCTIPKKLGIAGEDKLKGSLVFYEVKNLLKKIKTGSTCIVIGGGDAAFDYSLNLAERNVRINGVILYTESFEADRDVRLAQEPKKVDSLPPYDSLTSK